MKILITGAAGFIGSNLCESQLKAGHDVVGVDDLNSFYLPAIKQKNLDEVVATAKECGSRFVFHKIDLRQAESVEGLFKGQFYDVVVHLAAMAGVRPSMEKPALYHDVNVTGTAILFEAARRQGIRRLVFASSSSVYGNNNKVPFAESDSVDCPISHYAASKKAGELLCHVYHKTYDMTVATLRFFTVYGPRQRPDLAIHKFVELMYQGKPLPVFGDGNKSRDFTYIDDTVDGITRAIAWVVAQTKPAHEIFNLGEAQTISVNEMIATLESATGLSANRNTLPDMPGDVEKTWADLAKSRTILGYNPQTPFVDGVHKFVAWYKSRYHPS